MLDAAPPPGKLGSDVPDLVESGHQLGLFMACSRSRETSVRCRDLRPKSHDFGYSSVSPEVAVTASRQSLLQPLLEPIQRRALRG